MLAAFALFAVALGVVLASDGVPGIDARVASFVAAQREPWLTGAFKVVTRAGEYAVLVPMLALVGVWLWRSRGTRTPLVGFAVALAGGSLLSNAIKLAVARDRPPDALEQIGTHAFPSGHATAATSGWLALALVAGGVTASRPLRVAAVAIAVAAIASVGISRVYLGVHWTTDVLGGWALGTLCAMAALRSVVTFGKD